MTFNESQNQEKAYLQKIISIIKNAIGEINTSLENQAQDLHEQKMYLWENRGEIDPHEQRVMRKNYLNTIAVGENTIARRKRLRETLKIPYFGRIDFQEKTASEGIQPIYIGTNTFYDYSSKTNLIYDWRAPISGMFYDYELGEASYNSPEGKVEGNITLKRQYRIRGGVMEYMIESSVTVHDDILQKELSASADNKMRNIVATIQREQNRIIRNDDAYTLIIQGVAGSGKTSIALHRIAYLLYAYKGELSSKDILIISPNKVFADYISNVLPELGEETVPEVSMEELLSNILGNKYKFQTFFGQVGELLNKPSSEFIKRVKYKSSFEFILELDRFIIHVENNHFRPIDVAIRHLTIPHEYIGEEFRRFHRYPIRQRFDIMAEHIIETMEIQYKTKVTTDEKNMLKKEIRKMFAGQNDLLLYKEFFEWAGAPEMFKLRKNRTLEYADLAPLAYLHVALGGLKSRTDIKHLLIDEMQDYSPIQYKLMLKLFPCRKTILGDASQSVNPYGSSTADMIQRAFVTGEVMKLNKSYRSTYEITEFAQKIRSNNKLEVVERHGNKPEIINFKNWDEEVDGIKEMVENFRRTNHQSLGIICKDEVQASELYEKLKKYDDVYFLSHENLTFVKGITVISAHMSKGLEFDEVIVPHVDSKNYHTEIDRSMLYVAVTRAMHRLTLTYTGEVTEFLK